MVRSMQLQQQILGRTYKNSLSHCNVSWKMVHHVVGFLPRVLNVFRIRQISEFTNIVDLIYMSDVLDCVLYFPQSLTKGVEVNNPVLQCVVTVRFVCTLFTSY